VIAKRKYGLKCDVFSFGMVLCELVTGHYPFDGAPKDQVPTKTTLFETAIVAVRSDVSSPFL
jgi:serine/threonine protein kinase